MSQLRANTIVNVNNDGSPTFPFGITGITSSTNAGYAEIAGIATAAEGLTGTPNIVVGNITAVNGTFTGDVSVAGTVTYQDVTDVNAVGVITATQGIQVGAGQSISPVSGEIYYYGDGSNLTGLNVPAGFNELDAALFN